MTPSVHCKTTVGKSTELRRQTQGNGPTADSSSPMLRREELRSLVLEREAKQVLHAPTRVVMPCDETRRMLASRLWRYNAEAEDVSRLSLGEGKEAPLNESPRNAG